MTEREQELDLLCSTRRGAMSLASRNRPFCRHTLPVSASGTLSKRKKDQKHAFPVD